MLLYVSKFSSVWLLGDSSSRHTPLIYLAWMQQTMWPLKIRVGTRRVSKKTLEEILKG